MNTFLLPFAFSTMVGAPHPKESEEVLEQRTLQAVEYLNSCPNPNISSASENSKVAYDHLYGRLRGKSCRQNREGPNRKLSKAQEASICAFYDVLDIIGLSPRLHMVERSANAILAENHSGSLPVPVVSEHLATPSSKAPPGVFQASPKSHRPQQSARPRC